MQTDIIIIGGGVIGTTIARELSKYDVEIILLEKEDDVAMGTSKANSGIIHAGYNAEAATIKGKLNVKANPVFDDLCNKLKVPFKRIGSLVIGFHEEDLKVLKKEKINGEKIGVQGLEILNRDELLEKEPNISPEAQYALFAPTAGIISSYEFTIAMADNAVLNGAKIMLNTKVNGLLIEEGQIKGVKTDKGQIEAPIVINAAGLFADKIAQMAGINNYHIIPRKGEYHLLDKKWGDYVKHILFPVPSKVSKGILVTPTVHNNLLIGPNSNQVDNRNDLTVTRSGLKEVYEAAVKMVPGIERSAVITSFSGLRAVEKGNDFVINISEKVRGFINVLGIQSPGLTSAPAIAENVVELIKELQTFLGLKDLDCKENFIDSLPDPHILAENIEAGQLDKWQDIISKNQDYGEIICRCESITRGEIIQAINRPVQARSLDAIKRRTRAGAGRCQGGFCSPKVLSILTEELGISPLKITKKGKGSEILIAKTKDLINKGGANNA